MARLRALLSQSASIQEGECASVSCASNKAQAESWLVFRPHSTTSIPSIITSEVGP